jgi:hypothetical protein
MNTIYLEVGGKANLAAANADGWVLYWVGHFGELGLMAVWPNMLVINTLADKWRHAVIGAEGVKESILDKDGKSLIEMLSLLSGIRYTDAMFAIRAISALGADPFMSGLPPFPNARPLVEGIEIFEGEYVVTHSANSWLLAWRDTDSNAVMDIVFHPGEVIIHSK